MEYGYVRASKNAVHRELAEQRQSDLLLELGAEKIIVETDGSQLPDLLLQLKSGDAVHVVSIDRLTRSARRLSDILGIFRKQNVTLYEAGQKINLESMMLFSEAFLEMKKVFK